MWRSLGPLSPLPPTPPMLEGSPPGSLSPTTYQKGFLRAHGVSLCLGAPHRRAGGVPAQSSRLLAPKNPALRKSHAGVHLGNCLQLPPSSRRGHCGSCPSLLSVLGELLSSTPAPSKWGEPPCPPPPPAWEETWHTHHRFTSERAALSLCGCELVPNRWHQRRTGRSQRRVQGQSPHGRGMWGARTRG